MSKGGNSGSRDVCRDCPTAHAVADLRAHQIADLQHWGELKSELQQREERYHRHMDALTDEVARLTNLVCGLVEKVTELDETIRLCDVASDKGRP